MLSLEKYTIEAQRAVTDTVDAFHLHAAVSDGSSVIVPCSYQILEPGFRPFRAGKASPQELQSELDSVLEQAEKRGIDPGIEDEEALRKLAIQLGLGIDCSNLAFRSLDLLHDRLGIGPYTSRVFRSAAEIQDLNANKDSWAAKNEDGSPRSLTDEEVEKLETADVVEASWVASVFGKDPEFIIGSRHMTDMSAAYPVEQKNTLPGDLLAFKKAGSGAVSHLAVVETVDEVEEGVIHVDFWHSWHTRDFESGLRRDAVTLEGDSLTWSHEGLASPTRYEEHFFCRPTGMAELTVLFEDQLSV